MSNTCCAPSANKPKLSPSSVVNVVNAAYSARARDGVSSVYAANVAEAFGYTEEQLRSVPEGAHMGLSCGNPVATASIKEGEVVVDLGSGGGIDVFLAADKVGSNGKVIGIDFSTDMINLARKNAAKRFLKPPHVSFVEAPLTEGLPLETNSVDCILSNCVINLLPFDGKASLLKEVHRILKPGGRVVLDDIVAKKALPDDILADLSAYVGCISGAITEEEYKELMNSAGLSDVLFVDTKGDLNVYYESGLAENTVNGVGCCTPLVPGLAASKPSYDVNEWVGSYQIYAIKDKRNAGEVPSNVLLRWWDAFPKPISILPSSMAEEVAALIRERKTGFAIIDVRKDDHAGGHVKGSYNAPWFAQSFHSDLPLFFEKFKDTPKVFFYCQSSNGRGPRCAGWYQDYLNANGNHNSAAYVLQGGIKNWLATFSGEEDLVEYD